MSYANQSAASVLIHHLGSSGWMKLDGCAPYSVPHSFQQSERRGCWVGLDLLSKGGERPLGRIERAKGCPFLSIILEADLLSPCNFSQDTTTLLKSDLRMGCLGASETSISVNKLSGTGLIHHGYWVTAKDPTVIRLSFFSAK